MISVPNVSILMPMRDAEAHILSAIQSILSEDTVTLETIVVNDGSTRLFGRKGEVAS